MIASFIKRYQEILQEATPLRFPHRGVGPRAGVRAYGSEGAPVHYEKKKGVRSRFGARGRWRVSRGTSAAVRKKRSKAMAESLGAPPPPSGRSDLVFQDSDNAVHCDRVSRMLDWPLEKLEALWAEAMKLALQNGSLTQATIDTLRNALCNDSGSRKAKLTSHISQLELCQLPGMIDMGICVRIEGLKAKPELNGRLGRVQAYSTDKGRYAVMLDDNAAPMAVKAGNLTRVGSTETENGSVQLKPKPRSVWRPPDLPPLYPGPPAWLSDPHSAMRRHLWPEAASMPPSLREMILQSYLSQRRSDERYRHLMHLYGAGRHGDGDANRRRGLDEHNELFRQAGYDFAPVLTAAARAPMPPRTLLEAYNLMKSVCGRPRFVEDAGGTYVPLSPLPPRACQYCDRPCIAECRCGEAYCDKDCQAADWDDHRTICAICLDNQQFGMELNARIWGNRVMR